MAFLSKAEPLFLRMPVGFTSRIRIFFYRLLGLKVGAQNRMESIRMRRLSLIVIGEKNAFTQGCWLWPEDSPADAQRIRIGDRNFFNRDIMIDACGLIEIGNDVMIGPGTYITDSNHGISHGKTPAELPMVRGHVKIGNRCWIGAKVVILKDVELGEGCVVAAGAVVTKSFPAGSIIMGVPARLVRTVEP